MAGYNKRHLLVKNEGRLSEPQKERGAWLWEAPRDRFGLPDPEEKILALARLGIEGGPPPTENAYPALEDLR
jgi:hypothetical protein